MVFTVALRVQQPEVSGIRLAPHGPDGLEDLAARAAPVTAV